VEGSVNGSLGEGYRPSVIVEKPQVGTTAAKQRRIKRWNARENLRNLCDWKTIHGLDGRATKTQKQANVKLRYSQ